MATNTHPVRRRMKKARQKAGITEAEMAQMRCRSKGAIYYNETDLFRPTDELIQSYADTLAPFIRVSAKYLRTGRYGKKAPAYRGKCAAIATGELL